MGIDITQEDLIRLNEARQLKCLPPARNGKRIALCTLYRWAFRGVGGVRLETLKVGGSVCTTLEALQRFFDALSSKRDFAGQPDSNSLSNVSAVRQMQIDDASRRVDEILYGKGRKPGKMDAEMAAAMKSPSLSHLSPEVRRRHLEAERRLAAAGL